MKIPELINNNKSTGFSFEILPPLKGSSIDRTFATIDLLREFNPLFVNITSHRSEVVYKDTEDGLFRRMSQRSRPGTVAVAAAISHKYGLPVVPHLICSGFSATETEYALIDLNFLGITNVLVLRGDKGKHEARFTRVDGGHSHAIELAEQINRFNNGYFWDGTAMEGNTKGNFSYGVAGYPEKHDEAPNIDEDIRRLKEKIDAGAEYIITQMFFDNNKYFEFVDKCRQCGIKVPIIPGLKPITLASQLSTLPKIFHVDIPSELTNELLKCKDDASVSEVGIEWCTMQARELKEKGVPSIHFYSLRAAQSVARIAKMVY